MYRIEMIVAISEGNVIGYKGKMPWGRIPLDMAHFKEITDGQIMVVGFNTLVSIGKELLGRKILVLTHNPAKLIPFPWCTAVTEIDDILEMAETKRVIIAGGEVVYREFLPYVTTIHLTRIQANLEGDAFSPRLYPGEWHRILSDFHKPSEKNAYPLTFEKWVRRSCEADKKMAA